MSCRSLSQCCYDPLGRIALDAMDGDLVDQNMECEAATDEEKPPPKECWSEPIKVSDFVAQFEGNSFVDESALVLRKRKVSYSKISELRPVQIIAVAHGSVITSLCMISSQEIDRQSTLERWMSLDEETMNSLKRTMDPKNLLCGDEEIGATICPETEDWASLNLRGRWV